MKKLIFIIVVVILPYIILGSLFILIVLFTADTRPSPVTGKVVYDIPSLLWKNIDEIVEVLADSSLKKTDSLALEKILKQQNDYREEVKSRNSGSYDTLSLSNQAKGYFEDTKDGWKIRFIYDMQSRKINNVELYTNRDSYSEKSYNNNQLSELMLVGNLSLADSNKYVIWFNTGGFGSMKYKYGSFYDLGRETFTSMDVRLPDDIPHNH